MKDPGIWCGDNGGAGDVFCKSSSQVCCVTSDGFGGGGGGGGGINQACESSGIAACAGGLAVGCDDSADCSGGQVCCGTLTNDGYHSVQCQPSCTSTPATTAVRFCDGSAAKDECAPLGKTCQPSMRLPGYSVCQ